MDLRRAAEPLLEERRADLRAAAAGEADEDDVRRLLRERPRALAGRRQPLAREPLGEDRDVAADLAAAVLGDDAVTAG